MTNLAGRQAATRDDIHSHLGPHTVDRRIGVAGGGLVMAAGRHASGDAATDLDDGDLMAFRAGTHSQDGLAGVFGDPSGLVVVAVVLGDSGSALDAPTPEESQGQKQDEAETSYETHRPVPSPSLVHGDTQGKAGNSGLRALTVEEREALNYTMVYLCHRFVTVKAEGA